MKRRYVGKKKLIEKGTVCDVMFSYNKGFEEYMAIAVVPPYSKTVTLYYPTKEAREEEWEGVLKDGDN